MSSNHRLKSHQKLIGLSLLLVLFIQKYDNVACQEYPPTSFTEAPIAGNPSLEGAAKFLLCRTNSNPIPNYRWLKDGLFITNASASTYSYRINQINRSDAGRYRCEASNPLGTMLSAPADIKVAYMGKFDGHGLEFTLTTTVGKAIVIEVPKINSYPPAIITWSVNTQLINTEGPKYQVTLSGSLVLLDREISESGSNYKVEALNGNTNTLELGPSYNIIVTGNSPENQGPTLVVGSRDKIAYEDQDARIDFECIFNARPIEQLQISWYKITDVRNQILADNKFLISSIAQRTLTIVNPKQSDIGTYECEAFLPGYDRVSASANLAVYVNPKWTNHIPKTIAKDFGQTVTINCTGSGFPTPTIHWYLNAKELDKDFISSSYTLHPNGSLTVSQLALEHDGVYQYFLRNAAGVTAKATWLKVNSSPPVMITAPSDITILEGGDARLTCETKGAPKPVVTWKKDIIIINFNFEFHYIYFIQKMYYEVYKLRVSM